MDWLVLGGTGVVVAIALQLWTTLRPAKPLALSGLHVFVTGGSQGLGFAIAKHYAEAGARVSIVARSAAALDTARKQLEAVGTHQVFAAPCDVTDFAAVLGAVDAANAFHGRVTDHVVCNAGISEPGFLLDQSNAVFHRLMEVNYFGTLHAVKAALPAMVARGSGGKFIFINSGCGVVAFAGFAQYAASKFAIRGLADALRNELRLFNMTVHCFYPGSIDTPMFAGEQAQKPDITKAIEGSTELVSPEAATASLMRGVANGTYAITNDVGIWAGRVMGNGICPRATMAEALLAPILVIAQVCFGWYMDGLVLSEKRNQKEKEKHA
ncbi:3-ketodihydrosphingosine reductase [Achlya hypogyna]|uniref:3-dehydrosphinganine reductase n=1 Tax=Achlya hypogyna TaxID=1202772 RepID=A0A1V9Y682_ACHHY|nr:3-ketodihydrosphingosine reductase [Achlya hypogyna]